MKKSVCIFVVIVFSMGALLACENPIIAMLRPTSQLGSIWASEDGLIRFETQDLYSAKGTMQVDGATIDVYMDFDYGTTLYIHPVEVMEESIISYETIIETWSCSFISMEKFTAIVKETTHFEEGQTFIFYRVSSGDGQDGNGTMDTSMP